MSRFDGEEPVERCGDTVVRADAPGVCRCGADTRHVSLTLAVYVCSEECHTALWVEQWHEPDE